METQSHSAVIEANPYPGTIVQKLECVGHVQKRCGSRLRSIKNCKDKVTVDGKSVLALQKLTSVLVNYRTAMV